MLAGCGLSRSHDAMIRVCDEAGNVIETHEQAVSFKEAIRLFRSKKYSLLEPRHT
jgi:hypothetical protein